MQSVTNSGLKPKVIEHYKREIVQSYGFQHLLSFINLEKCGLIKPQVFLSYLIFFFNLLINLLFLFFISLNIYSKTIEVIQFFEKLCD